ncbi:MAG: SAM-dependent methyltransferase [Kineosporiaceae bacterium]
MYGQGGFYRRTEGPAGHFRTASHASPLLLASALARLAAAAGCTGIVDIGAGRGELLAALDQLTTATTPEVPATPTSTASPASMTNPASTPSPASTPTTTAMGSFPTGFLGGVLDGVPASGLRLHGVDVVDRPAGLPDRIGWSAGLDKLAELAGDSPLSGSLVIAWELLDVVPCPVVEVDDAGTARVVLVDPFGRERHGSGLSPAERDWCTRWWPLDGAEPGTRAEIGLSRDRLWAELVSRVADTPDGGLLLAVDYAHSRGERPVRGSLTGFREGRQVPPRPDGRGDITAHVALDAVAVAGAEAASTAGEVPGTTEPFLVTQREALRRLGLADGTGPHLGRLGPADGTGPHLTSVPGSAAQILAALQYRSQIAELLDPGGLGGFSWLLQPVGRSVPPLLTEREPLPTGPQPPSV